MNTPKRINKIAFSEMLWDNYYTLGTTPIEAMAIIWEEYAHGTLASWAMTEHGIDQQSLIRILSMLTLDLGQMDLSKNAMNGAAQ